MEDHEAEEKRGLQGGDGAITGIGYQIDLLLAAMVFASLGAGIALIWTGLGT
jgi:hypothetical protein